MRESPMRYPGGHVSSSERTNLSSRSARRWVLALTSMASLMVMLDMLVVTTALSTIRLHLGASIEQLEWTVNAYTLSLAVLFTAASAACALAPSVGWLIAARAVQGAGAAMVVPLAMALLGAAFPAEQRARALGFFSGVTGLATVGGPLVGGAVVQGLAWQWIFWLNVPIGLLLIPLVLSRIEEGLGSRTSLDLGGLALVTGAALGLVWGLVRANGFGWGSLEVVASLAAGALLLVAFVAWELRVREPMLPMRFFRSRAFSAGNTAGFLLYGAIFGAAFFFAQFLQTTLHYGPLGTGLRLVPCPSTLSLVAPIAGARVNRLRERPLIVAGLLLQAAAFAR